MLDAHLCISDEYYAISCRIVSIIFHTYYGFCMQHVWSADVPQLGIDSHFETPGARPHRSSWRQRQVQGKDGAPKEEKDEKSVKKRKN